MRTIDGPVHPGAGAENDAGNSAGALPYSRDAITSAARYVPAWVGCRSSWYSRSPASRSHASSHAVAAGSSSPFTSSAASAYDSIARSKSARREEAGQTENSALRPPCSRTSASKRAAYSSSSTRLSGSDDGPCCSTT
jgi:hypothetical protein